MKVEKHEFVDHQSMRKRINEHGKTHLDAVLAIAPEVLAQLDNSAKNTDENVCVDTPLVRLINADDGVFVEEEVARELAEKDAIRHELDARLRRSCRVVPNLVRDA